jgi:hypothetical protein
MLTRCKAGMVIVSNRVFLRTGSQRTLLGRLAQHWVKRHGESNTWTDWRDIAEMKADMPGAPGRHRAIPPSANATITEPTSTVTWAPIGPPASQLQGTGQKLRKSSSAKEEFPALGNNGPKKPVARGMWNSSAGHSAVKRVTAASVTSGGTHSSSGYSDRLTDSPNEPERLHIRSPKHRQGKKVRGQRKK